jgi:hypothetical protein
MSVENWWRENRSTRSKTFPAALGPLHFSHGLARDRARALNVTAQTVAARTVARQVGQPTESLTKFSFLTETAECNQYKVLRVEVA